MTGNTPGRDSPILLFGMPRSGTTWIGKIFDSHPDTLYRHEPDSRGALNAVPLLVQANGAKRYGPAVSDFLRRLPRLNQTKVCASLPLFPKSYYSDLRFRLRRLSVLSAKAGSRLLGELPVPHWVDYDAVPQLRVVWKSIESLGRLGLVARSAETCRAVHIIRHPCGYVASVLRGESKGKFGGQAPSSEDYGLFALLLETEQARARGLTLGALKRMEPVERLAWRWVLFNEKAMDDVRGLSNCALVRYEDVCQDPLGTSRRLFDFAGLPWHPQTEAFIGQSTGQENGAYYSVFKNPRKAANKWRGQLAPADIDRIMAVVADSRPGALYGDANP
jgi:hypothetical protein